MIDPNQLPIIIGGALIVLVLLIILLVRLRRSASTTKSTPPPAPAPDVAPAGLVASLEFTDTTGKAITFTFDKPVTLLGRGDTCDIVLPDSLADIDTVSRQHAQFNRDEDGLIVHDLESRNSLMVNGRHTNHNLLEDGDRLTFGRVEAIFHNK